MINRNTPSDQPLAWMKAATRFALLGLFTAFLVACSDGSDSPAPAAEPSFPVDYDDPELEQRLAMAFDSWVEDGELVGASIQLHSPGRFDWSRSQGLVLKGEDTPFTEMSPVRAGSVTKPMTAIVILQLVEEGLLSLDTPLSAFLDYPNGDQITVKHLLQHRSGIYDVTLRDTVYIFSVLADSSVWITPQEVLDWTYGDQPIETFSGELVPREPVAEPGEVFHYSQPGYIALGYMIEEVTQQSVVDVYEERIFAYLGMDSTRMPAEDDPHFPITYTDGFGIFPSQLPSNVILPSLNSMSSSAWTAGGVVTTTADLAKLIPAIVGGDLLSDESFQLMTEWVPIESGLGGENSQYGLGLFYRPQEAFTTIGHGGSVPGSGAEMTYIEDYELYIVATRNSDVLRDDENPVPGLLERLRRALNNEPQ